MSDEENQKVQQINIFLDSIGWGKYSTFNFIVCGGAWFSITYLSTAVSFLMRSAKDEWDLESYEVGLINTAHMSGIFLGSAILGLIGDRYGRVYAFKISGIMSVIGALLLTFSQNYAMLIPFTFIEGLGAGGELATGGPSYLEACPPKKRWTLVLISACWIVGAIGASLIALIFTVSGFFDIEIWRIVTFCGAIIEFINWVPRLFLYESSRYLLIHHRDDESEKVLCNIARINRSDIKPKFEVQIEESRLSESLKGEGTRERLVHKANTKDSLKMILGKKYIKYTLLFTFTLMLVEIAYSTMASFMPIFLDKVGGKVSGDTQLYYTLIIQQSVGIPGIFLSTYLVETRLGRRWTISISFLIMGVLIFLFYSADSYPLLVVFSSLMFFFNYLGYSALYTMIAEFFPTEVRSIAVGWTNSWNKFAGVVTPAIIGVLLGMPGGLTISILICSIGSISSGLLCMKLPETKGAELG
ncbi:yceI_1 [Blepharisma stoltei]|uniref:Major facilitator superfamily (MFS) profile domain-containing protein n=1 Tax=Blepharisma stoltei TaxID=1481888 RepID=A0AAU9IV03_9CILI|nr:unnamed protein product [Blepharisma stoltei]